jgi:hypothetical protein
LKEKVLFLGRDIKNAMLKKLCYTFILMLFTTVLCTAANTDFTGVSMRDAAKSGVTVLGKYPDYINLSSELGAKRFNIPTNIWNKMTSADQWAANVKFLDRMIVRGDKIVLSNRVMDINKVSGAFRQELDYLISKGYRLSSDGLQMIK